MENIKVLKHRKGAPGLRLLGLGPRLIPLLAMEKLQQLLNKNAFWAQHRSKREIKKMLSNSNVIVSVWKGKNIIGFGRALSDETYRAVLWDIVVDKDYHYLGIGKQIIDSILENTLVSKAEKIYLMTTYCKEFYIKMGFKIESNQTLMYINQK